MYRKNLDFNKKLKSLLQGKEITAEEKEKYALMLAKAEINEYVLENIIMGNITSGDMIPFSTYVYDLGICCNTYRLHYAIESEYITAQERIANINMDACRRAFFDEQIKRVLLMQNFVPSAEYLNELYKIFYEILDTDSDTKLNISMSLFHMLKNRIEQLILGICKGEIKEGDCVGLYTTRRYKEIFILERLVNAYKGIRLQVADINILEIKLLILATFRFKNYNNELLFEEKLAHWFDKNR